MIFYIKQLFNEEEVICMDKNLDFDFSIEEIEINMSEMDNADVLAGCWGDTGSDWANTC